MLYSDHAITGKFYKKLDSFVFVQNPSQSSPTFGSLDFFLDRLYSLKPAASKQQLREVKRALLTLQFTRLLDLT